MRFVFWISCLTASAAGAQIPEPSILSLQKDAQPQVQSYDKSPNWTLTNIQPEVSRWWVFTPPSGPAVHLYLPFPGQTQLQLSKTEPGALDLVSSASTEPCAVLDKDGKPLSPVDIRPFSPLCNEKVYHLRQTAGNTSSKEAVADFLRKNIWGGEEITSLVKDWFFKDKFALEGQSKSVKATKPRAEAGKPAQGQLDPKYEAQTLAPTDMGLPIGNPSSTVAGQWYHLDKTTGVFWSSINPGWIRTDILKSFPKDVQPLDEMEKKKLAYLVAFDLEQFQLGYTIGTDHPSLEWSGRVPTVAKTHKGSGPDGFDDKAPFVTAGKVPPQRVNRTVGAFTAGFKRYHGAFRRGKLALNNQGSHYGFMEEGVLFSRLHPGLATVSVTTSGNVRLHTWKSTDSLKGLVYARQNGVPLLDVNAEGETVPGEFVNNWGLGNWSGSQEKRLRTLRAGLCLSEHEGRKWLIYGWFSAATPNAMTRVFQAYSCKYAMHLDMNALEHTYLATYTRDKEGRPVAHHLHTGMKVLDKEHQGHAAPRFLNFSDNRDFFYLYKSSKD